MQNYYRTTGTYEWLLGTGKNTYFNFDFAVRKQQIYYILIIIKPWFT